MAHKKYPSNFIILVLIFLSLAATTAIAQPVTKPAAYPAGTLTNYIRTWEASAPETDPTALQSRPLKDVKQTTQYIDGLGRPLQTVEKQGSMATGSSPTDMVSANVYDSFGREQYRYLPFSSSATDGSFKTNPFQQQETFMQAQYGAQGEQYFYAQTQFETSPLDRVLKSFSAGNSWVGTINNSGTAQHGVGMQYVTNDASDSVQIWDIDNSGAASSYGAYANGQLYENHTADEHGKEIVEYLDKEGQLILKKVQLAASPSTGHYGWLCTYYVYDDFGKQRLVIQPRGVELAQAASWQLSAAILDEFCFQYNYDQRLRMIYKKAPGAAPMNLVYDVRDRLVLSQDGNMAAAGKWMYTLYDSLNRSVATGLWQTSATAATLQTAAYYSDNYPNLSGQIYEEMTDTYYDNYNWAGSLSSSLNTFNASYASSFVQTANNSTWPYPQAVVQSSATNGLPTGRRVKVLGTSNFLNTVIFYDDKGRPLQTRSDNNLGGTDVSTTQYAWAGLPMAGIIQHQKTGTNPQTHVIATITSYDDLFRPVTISKAINSTINGVAVNTATKVIDSVYYDKLGQMATKVLSPSFNTKGLQRSAYDYNIRGWTLGMNRNFIAATAAPITASTTDYFGFELAYDNASSIIGGASYAAQQYNGNVSGGTWKSIGDNQKRRYDYAYDAANRLLKADFNQYTGGAFNKTAGVDFSVQMGDGADPLSAYDANGNVLSMQHTGLYMGSSVKIDSLVYTYQNNGASNKLAKVADLSTAQTNGLGDFKDGSNTSDDYTYDANGNMTLDNNKGITAANGGNGITYNYMSRPETIAVNPAPTAIAPHPITGTITYTYSASGAKLRKTTVENDTLTGSPKKMTVTEYDGVFSYQSIFSAPFPTSAAGNDLQYFQQEEGRIRYLPTVGTTAAHFAFDYFLKDHLGNTRMVLTDENPNEVIPKLGMELADTTVAMQYFSNITSSRSIKPNNFNCQVYATYPDTISYAAKMTGVDTAYIGPFTARRVMNGDSITIKVESYYRTHDNNASLQPALTAAQSLPNLLQQVASGLVQAGQGATTAQLLANTTLQNSVTTYLNNLSTSSGKPQAGVYWLALDNQLNFLPSASGFAQVGSGGCGVINPTIPKATTNGYIFVFVGNQTQQLFVYYDNLQLAHVHSPVLEETSYYGFGLTMAGISSRSGKLENKIKFTENELQHQEFSDGTGLETMDFNERMYDHQVGRFWQADPAADLGVMQGVYNFCDNNPINYTDPSGLTAGFPDDKDKRPATDPITDVTVTPHGNFATKPDNTYYYYSEAPAQRNAIHTVTAADLQRPQKDLEASQEFYDHLAWMHEDYVESEIQGTYTSYRDHQLHQNRVVSGALQAPMIDPIDLGVGFIAGASRVLLKTTVEVTIEAEAEELPMQLHHFATNKHSVFTPQMEGIAKQFGLGLDESWNKQLLPHLGRHPNDYHKFVLQGMTDAANEAGGSTTHFLQLFQQYVKDPVIQNPSLLRKIGWQ